jgi:CDP-diacylglycerol---serine O-phosphatidyltransferase
MRHIPNILTLSNLFCGCVSIAFTLFSAPFQITNAEEQYWVPGGTSFYWGAMFIFFAGLADWLDGAAARWLKVESPLGGDLDSLSDVVSFGVAPSMIVMKLLWMATMNNPNAMSTSIFAVSPAFLIACFGALRLAIFNNAPKNNIQFTGTPIPSIGIFIAGLGLIVYKNELGLASLIVNQWFLYAVIAFTSWAMVSKIKLFTMKIENFAFGPNWGRYLLIIICLALLPILKFAIVPVAFLLYILISFFYKPTSSH